MRISVRICIDSKDNTQIRLMYGVQCLDDELASLSLSPVPAPCTVYYYNSQQADEEKNYSAQNAINAVCKFSFSSEKRNYCFRKAQH